MNVLNVYVTDTSIIFILKSYPNNLAAILNGILATISYAAMQKCIVVVVVAGRMGRTDRY